MDIVTIIKDTLVKQERVGDSEFFEQIRDAERFSQKMANAGVTPKKKTFTIPLMDRICSNPTN